VSWNVSIAHVPVFLFGIPPAEVDFAGNISSEIYYWLIDHLVAIMMTGPITTLTVTYKTSDLRTVAMGRNAAPCRPCCSAAP